jgi:protein-disulfide isomerase
MRQFEQYLEDSMAKHKMDKKHRKQQRKGDFWVILIISIFALAIVGLIVYSKIPKVTAPVNAISATESGLNMGNPDAKVKVVEFADFQCPYCQQYYQVLEPTIISNYVDTNLIYYTYSPMAFLGQESIDAAEAAYCANDQGKFWEYRAYLFTNLAGENAGSYTQTKLIAFASRLKLDTALFKTCLTTNKHQAEITAAAAYAQSVNISSTPSFLVNGVEVSGSQLDQAIKDALAK